MVATRLVGNGRNTIVNVQASSSQINDRALPLEGAHGVVLGEPEARDDDEAEHEPEEVVGCAC